MSEDNEDNFNTEKSFMLFGRDISKIPCFRNSLLYGIGGGLTFGLGHFMFTSLTLKSVNFATYSFSLITLAYWIQCRYQFSRQRFEMMRIQELMRQNAIYEGTAEDPPLVVDKNIKPIDV